MNHTDGSLTCLELTELRSLTGDNYLGISEEDDRPERSD